MGVFDVIFLVVIWAINAFAIGHSFGRNSAMRDFEKEIRNRRASKGE